MQEITNFIENYYCNNLMFDQDGFLKLIDILVNAIGSHRDPASLNAILLKIMDRYQKQDFYAVMQIIEYELLGRL